MMKKSTFFLSLIVITVFSYACQTHPTKVTTTPVELKKPLETVNCKDPRPQICTREYRPVCANLDTGV